MQDKSYLLSSRESTQPAHRYLHILPVQLTPLLGREQEEAAVCNLLHRREIRLLTLTGAGGIGKTRLALQVATDLLDGFADGVYFVSLAHLSDSGLVLPTIVQTFDLKETPGWSPLEQLKAFLRDKHLLVLLDNFEQVIMAAPLLVELLYACSELKLLVTSRVRLRVSGEHELPVQPLALPDSKHLPETASLLQYAAVALFVQRAQAIKPDFQLTASNAQTIAKICLHLDGLPLAIELAAARLKLLSPLALLARLSQRLRVLTDGVQDAPVRQQTLRNTLAWSYDLLSADEQRLFRRLSVFVGGCTLEAIEAVCSALGNGALSALQGVASLIDKSLLWQREPEAEEPRFLMLETIREYGLEVLEASGEEQLTRQAHAHYYLALAEGAESHLHGPEQAGWFDRLEQERDNLRASLHWLLERAEDRERIEMALRLGSALWWFWLVRGPVSEGWTELSQALARSKEVAVAVRAKALWAAGWLAGLSGDSERAEALCKESVALFREIGDKAGVAMASLILGIAALWKSQPAVARSRFEGSLALFRELGDKEYIGWSIYHLAAVDLFQGEYTRAHLLFEESLALFKELGNTGAVTIVSPYLGQALFFQGDAAKAQVVLEEGLALSKQIGFKQWEAFEFGILGQVFLHQGNFALARSAFEENLALSRQMGDREGTGFSLCLLARVEAGQGNHATARVLYEESLALSRDLANHSWEIASYLEGLAELVVPEGEPAWAARLWGTAEALRETSGAPLPPVYRADYNHAVAAARGLLGEKAFTAAWAEGRSMTPDQALAARIPKVGSISEGLSTAPSAKLPTRYPDELTAREVEVLRLVAQGLSNAEIADQLIISLLTVKAHMRSLYNKLGISSRSSATRYAIEHHLL